MSFADTAAPLTDLLLHDKPLIWTEKEQKSFDQLKDKLTVAPVLALPNPEKPFIVTTDASQVAVGAVLSQLGDDATIPHPIAFLSRKLHGAEVNYPTHEQELLAIIYA